MIRDIATSIFFVLLFFIPLLIKRKRQLGQTWESGLFAKLMIANIPLTCKHCNAEHFYKREALIPTTFLALFGWTCWNKSGKAYVCKNCGLLHWFNSSVETEIEFVRDVEDTL